MRLGVLVLVLYSCVCCCCRWRASVAGQELNGFSCQNYNPLDRQVDVLKYAGTWYEVLRMPNSDAGICVSLQAPSEATSENGYRVEFDYVDNFTDKRRRVPVHQAVSIPWNEQTQAGIFQLQYGEVTVIFKLIPLPFPLTYTVAAVCGYALVPGSLPLLKLFATQSEPSAAVVEQINQLAEAYNVSEYITWVQQDGCDGAATQQLSAALRLFTLMVGVLVSVTSWSSVI